MMLLLVAVGFRDRTLLAVATYDGSPPCNELFAAGLVASVLLLPCFLSLWLPLLLQLLSRDAARVVAIVLQNNKPWRVQPC